MRILPALLLVFMSLSPALADTAEGGLHIRLDQVNALEGQCQLVFVLENDTGTDLQSLQAETVLLSPETRVLRLTLLDFQTLPQDGLRVRSFNLPGLDCAQLGRVLFNAVGPCTPLDAAACTAALRVSSDTDVEVLK